MQTASCDVVPGSRWVTGLENEQLATHGSASDFVSDGRNPLPSS